jgi:hypothetical protein
MEKGETMRWYAFAASRDDDGNRRGTTEFGWGDEYDAKLYLKHLNHNGIKGAWREKDCALYSMQPLDEACGYLLAHDEMPTPEYLDAQGINLADLLSNLQRDPEWWMA